MAYNFHFQETFGHHIVIYEEVPVLLGVAASIVPSPLIPFLFNSLINDTIERTIIDLRTAILVTILSLWCFEYLSTGQKISYELLIASHALSTLRSVKAPLTLLW